MTPDLKWLTDPTVFAVNRLDAHSDHVCYRSEADIRLGSSTLRQSLDGSWRFAYSACPAALRIFTVRTPIFRPLALSVCPGIPNISSILSISRRLCSSML